MGNSFHIFTETGPLGTSPEEIYDLKSIYLIKVPVFVKLGTVAPEVWQRLRFDIHIAGWSSWFHVVHKTVQDWVRPRLTETLSIVSCFSQYHVTLTSGLSIVCWFSLYHKRWGVFGRTTLFGAEQKMVVAWVKRSVRSHTLQISRHGGSSASLSVNRAWYVGSRCSGSCFAVVGIWCPYIGGRGPHWSVVAFPI